jgi:hypothetical protein
MPWSIRLEVDLLLREARALVRKDAPEGVPESDSSQNVK